MIRWVLATAPIALALVTAVRGEHTTQVGATAPVSGGPADQLTEIESLRYEVDSLRALIATHLSFEHELAALVVEIAALHHQLDSLTGNDRPSASLASLDGGWAPPDPSAQRQTSLPDGAVVQVTDVSPVSRPEPAIRLSGFVDASNSTDYNTSESSFGLDQVEIDVMRDFSNRAAVRADIEYVNDGLGGFNMDLEQGYLDYELGNATQWTFRFGKFNAPIGWEAADPPEMYQCSSGLVGSLGLPQDVTGVAVNVRFPASVDWTAYLTNGWDVNTDNNKDKTVGTRLGLAPTSNFDFGLAVVSGPEQDNNVSSRRTVFDFDFSCNVLPSWLVGGEINEGIETKSLVGEGDGTWSGFLLTNKWELGERYALTVRCDYFNDRDGLRTGVKQRLWAACVAPDVSFVDGLQGRFELRVDGSSDRTFVGNDGTSRDLRTTTALEFLYSFR